MYWTALVSGRLCCKSPKFDSRLDRESSCKACRFSNASNLVQVSISARSGFKSKKHLRFYYPMYKLTNKHWEHTPTWYKLICMGPTGGAKSSLTPKLSGLTKILRSLSCCPSLDLRITSMRLASLTLTARLVRCGSMSQQDDVSSATTTLPNSRRDLSQGNDWTRVWSWCADDTGDHTSSSSRADVKAAATPLSSDRSVSFLRKVMDLRRGRLRRSKATESHRRFKHLKNTNDGFSYSASCKVFLKILSSKSNISRFPHPIKDSRGEGKRGDRSLEKIHYVLD